MDEFLGMTFFRNRTVRSYSKMMHEQQFASAGNSGFDAILLIEGCWELYRKAMVLKRYPTTSYMDNLKHMVNAN